MTTPLAADLAACDVDALVAGVDTAGNDAALDADVAAALHLRYPDLQAERRRAARRGNLRLGAVHVWRTHQMTGPRFVLDTALTAPGAGRLDDAALRACLAEVAQLAQDLELVSLGVPLLGCAAGLDRVGVRREILRALSALPRTEVVLAGEWPAPGPPPDPLGPAGWMSPGHAALLAVLTELTPQLHRSPSLDEAQQLAYLLQAAGEPLRVHFVLGPDGPYAADLHHVLTEVESHYLGAPRGRTDLRTAEPLTVHRGAREAAATVLAGHPETARRVQRVGALVSGLTGWGELALLGSVHWLLTRAPVRAVDEEALLAAVARRNPRAVGRLRPEAVRAVVGRLVGQGWCPPLTAPGRARSAPS